VSGVSVVADELDAGPLVSAVVPVEFVLRFGAF